MPLATPASPPPLQDGDRLTSEEFLRRWEAMPDLKHAELIDGTVYMPSPISQKHSNLHFPLSTWLGIYTANTPGCWGGLEATWVMGHRDVPQPDLALLVLPEYGGQSTVEGEYYAGVPELIVEVALSSRARDLGIKLRLYERMGVHEYLVVVASQKRIIWHQRTAGIFQPIDPDADGTLRSRCFPGLWLDPIALWSRDQVRMHAVLNQGLASPEHAAFVARLAAQKR